MDDETEPSLLDDEPRYTVHDSSRCIKTGCDVQELDTIPAEFLELFK